MLSAEVPQLGLRTGRAHLATLVAYTPSTAWEHELWGTPASGTRGLVCLGGMVATGLGPYVAHVCP